MQIVSENIMWGQIQAYHPDLLYKKYGIEFFVKNEILEKELSVGSGLPYKEFYYYLNIPSKYTEEEEEILGSNNFQSYLKFKSENGDIFLFTVDGDGGGSANFRTIYVKLYKYKGKEIVLLFDKKETYSIDPGFDSNYFSENFKYLLYKIFSCDDRYVELK